MTLDNKPPKLNIKIEQKETIDTYEKVIFGHSFREFDHDQLITAYFAYKAGRINKDTTIEFKYKLGREHKDDLLNPQILVIEGVPSTMEEEGVVRNDKEKSNFDNNSKNDLPAAWEFWQTVQSEKGIKGDTRLVELANNFRNYELREKGRVPAKPDTENSFKLKEMKYFLKTVFNVIKNSGQSHFEILFKLFDCLDKLIDGGTDFENSFKIEAGKLQSMYAANETHLVKYLNGKSERFNAISTEAYGDVIFADIRGSGTFSRGTSAAAIFADQKGFNNKNRIYFLVNDIIDDEGKNHRPKFMIDFKGDFGRTFNVQDLLKERLTSKEKLFGGGIDCEFGGHTKVMLSDRGGSHLDVQTLWHSLARFLEHKRYTQKEFELKSKEVCKKMFNTENCETQLMLNTPEHEIPEQVIIFTLPHDGGSKRFIIKESELLILEDFFLYQCNSDPSSMRKVFLEKEILSEQNELSTFKYHQLKHKLLESISIPNVFQVLYRLDDMENHDIIGLAPDIKEEIVRLISNDPEAISAIWGHDSKIFSLKSTDAPGWIGNSNEKQKNEKYAFNSIIKYIEKSIIPHILTSQNGILSVIKILESKEFQNSEKDSLTSIYNTIKLGINNNPLLLNNKKIQNLLQEYEAKRKTELIKEKPINIELIKKLENEGIEQNHEVVVLLCFSIGWDMKALLKKQGIYTKNNEHVTGFDEFVGDFHIEKTIGLAPYEQDAEIVSDYMCRQIFDVLNHAKPETKIRVITSGFPARLTRTYMDTMRKLLQQKALQFLQDKKDEGSKEPIDIDELFTKIEELRGRIIFSDYNQQDKLIYDS